MVRPEQHREEKGRGKYGDSLNLYFPKSFYKEMDKFMKLTSLDERIPKEYLKHKNKRVSFVLRNKIKEYNVEMIKILKEKREKEQPKEEIKPIEVQEGGKE